MCKLCTQPNRSLIRRKGGRGGGGKRGERMRGRKEHVLSLPGRIVIKKINKFSVVIATCVVETQIIRKIIFFYPELLLILRKIHESIS